MVSVAGGDGKVVKVVTELIDKSVFDPAAGIIFVGTLADNFTGFERVSGDKEMSEGVSELTF